MISSKLAGERIAMLAVLALALAGCALGRLVPPPPAPHHVIQQAVDLVRIVCTLALAVSLLLGPGVAWRALGPADRPLGLGFVPLPGLLMLAAGGAVAWALGDVIDPWTISTILFVPVLLGIGGILAWGPAPMIFDEDERRVVLVVGCVLGLAIGRSLWSPGPEGELYAGTVSRTLEVGDRSDSRISYHVVQLVAAGEGPYGSLATELLKPYNFSSRGPLPGLAATPVVLLAGGHPSSTGRPVEPWVPFDEAGFMAYRLAMMSFAVVAFLALWDLVRRVAGRDGGYLAVLLAATTPFLVHEVWFTWPKMLAAGIVLLAAIGVVYRRPFRAGLLAGLGYLVHPGVLLAVPTLGLISLWPLSRARWNRPRVRDGLLLAIGLAIFLVAWRLVNGRHYDQSEFLDYFLRTGPGGTLGLGVDWVVSRLHSVGNTLVPLLLPVADAGNAAINVVRGTSPPVIHFFFGYWTTVPFGMAIVFLPLLVVGLWRAARRWPWPVTATVIVPFALFAVYWGSADSGLMREGLHAWALGLLAVIACEQVAARFGWLRSTPIRALLALRALEVLVMALIPTLVTRGFLISDEFPLTDVVAVTAMVGFTAVLAALVWTAPTAMSRVPARG